MKAWTVDQTTLPPCVGYNNDGVWRHDSFPSNDAAQQFADGLALMPWVSDVQLELVQPELSFADAFRQFNIKTNRAWRAKMAELIAESETEPSDFAMKVSADGASE